MKIISYLILAFVIIAGCHSPEKEQSTQEKLQVVILDGQNNHYVWPKGTMMMKDYLEETGLFDVDVYRMDSVWLGIKYNQSRPEAYSYFIETYPLDSSSYGISENPVQTSRFTMDFSQYDLVVSNLGAESAPWPEDTKKSFEDYMEQGGGLVVVHAANNAWGDWDAYNTMIGLGAWGGRDSATGPYVYYNDAGELERDASSGICGSHGSEYEYLLTTRAPEHPIMKGLPKKWMHTKDELYERMRGPFEHATILATAYADVERNAPPWDPTVKGLGQHVPLLMAINYGQGRIFHTALGHFDYSMEGVGFITTLQRGAEWAATGQVTQDIPQDFPSEKQATARPWKQ